MQNNFVEALNVSPYLVQIFAVSNSFAFGSGNHNEKQTDVTMVSGHRKISQFGFGILCPVSAKELIAEVPTDLSRYSINLQ